MNMKNKINLSGTLLTRLALFSIALLAFNSCRIYKSYERPENMPTSGLFRDTLTTTGVLTSDTINFGNTPWRQVFTDPALQSLIERALERNTDLLSAEETVKQAQAMLTASKLAYLPSLSLSPQGTISSFDGAKATKTYSVPVTASWQLDIFGSIRNAKEQSKSVLLHIASLYYTMLMLDEQLRITRETSEIWKKNVDAMEAMQKAAMTDAAAVEQSRANYLQVLATIPTLEQSIRESENALSVILREPPHTITRSTLAEQHMPENLSAGVPLQLLANRPDVRAAEYSLREAFYVTNAAYSAFYPQLTITGSAGWTNSNGMIVNPGKVLTTLIGQLTQPLFAQGRLTANLKVAKSQERVAQLNFEQALLNAGQEVSNALYSYKSSMEKANLDKKQVESLTITRDRTNELFKYDASTTYLEKLTAEMSLLNAQLTLVNDEYSKLQAVVDLYAALGGGRN